MNYILGIIGLVLGLFLWSNIIGSLLASLPLQLKLKKVGIISDIGWLRIILPTIFGFVVLILFFVFSKPMFFGSLIGGILMLFNFGNLKREAYETFRNENPDVFNNSSSLTSLDGSIDKTIEQNIINIINGTAPTNLKKSVIHKMIEQSNLGSDQKEVLTKKANKLLKTKNVANGKETIPNSKSPISDIWEYAKQFSQSKDGKDWNNWIGWGGEQYRIFKETGKLPDRLEELQSCLYQCYERDQISGDFHDGDVRQEFPRTLVKRIRELDGNQ